LIPAGLFIGALASWFFKKTVPTTDKIIVGAICLHSFFDFNLQFVGVFFLLLLLLSQEKIDKRLTVKPGFLLKASFGAAALAGLYLGVALMTAHIGSPKLADKLYPYNTQNKLSILEKTTTLEEANVLADSILKQNTHFYAPHIVKAKYHYSKGDFSAMIKSAQAALKRNPFDHTTYEDYCKMLLTGIDLYKKAGDLQSAEICQTEVLSIYQQFLSGKERLSTLGKMIDDQPVLELSPELVASISKLGA
jgi:tetratricopeptide (TPR) repeat protein